MKGHTHTICYSKNEKIKFYLSVFLRFYDVSLGRVGNELQMQKVLISHNIVGLLTVTMLSTDQDTVKCRIHLNTLVMVRVLCLNNTVVFVEGARWGNVSMGEGRGDDRV